jgi:ferredoxin
MTRVAIDAERCTGHGRCFTLSPDVFGSDEQGYSVVLVDELADAALLEEGRVAVDSCPEEAIRLEES